MARIPSHLLALIAAAATLPLAVPVSLRAAAVPQGFPPSQIFRDLQLATLACSRENTASTCEQARKLAEPLLDHPRLPASCKDSLWGITQMAQHAPSNSLARRDKIDQVARDVTAFCRQRAKAPAKETPAKP